MKREKENWRIVAIVQARMASTRLPGKVLRELQGKAVLLHTLERVASTPMIDEVICAIPDGADCDPIEVAAQAAGFATFRGSETDVLERHWLAAVEAKADAVIRITSDCPLITPEPISALIDLFLNSDAVLVTNNDTRTWLHGLDGEIFTMKALGEAHKEAVETFDREHVTPFIKSHRCRFKILNSACPVKDRIYVDQRWTLDTPADWAFFEALFDAYGPDIAKSTWQDVAEFVRTNDLPDPRSA